MASRSERAARAHRDLATELIGPQTRPPPEIFHYTSAHGLLEIVRSNELWATNLEFMNDFLEVRYARDLFKDVVEREKRTTRNETVLRFLAETGGMVDPLTGDFSFYAVSFCADGGDRLSQWRAYAGEGTGYSIGFRTDRLAESIQRYRDRAEGETGDMDLIQVVYRREKQEEIVENSLRKICHYIEKNLARPAIEDRERSLATLARLLCVHLLPYIFSFKTAGFEEEREWRLVTWIPSTAESNRIEFRASANFTIPYLSLNLSSRSPESSSKLPISRIIQGPRVETEAGMKGLELLVKKYGYTHAQVAPSKIPLRYVT